MKLSIILLLQGLVAGYAMVLTSGKIKEGVEHEFRVIWENIRADRPTDHSKFLWRRINTLMPTFAILFSALLIIRMFAGWSWWPAIPSSLLMIWSLATILHRLRLNRKFGNGVFYVSSTSWYDRKFMRLTRWSGIRNAAIAEYVFELTLYLLSWALLCIQ